MPHMVIRYTANLNQDTEMSVLCRRLADTRLAVHDEADKPLFPTAGKQAP